MCEAEMTCEVDSRAVVRFLFTTRPFLLIPLCIFHCCFFPLLLPLRNNRPLSSIRRLHARVCVVVVIRIATTPLGWNWERDNIYLVLLLVLFSLSHQILPAAQPEEILELIASYWPTPFLFLSLRVFYIYIRLVVSKFITLFLLFFFVGREESSPHIDRMAGSSKQRLFAYSSASFSFPFYPTESE